MSPANVDKYWDPGWKVYGTVNGKFYAAPLGANVKSLVWYSPKMFAAKGYTVPTTWDEMVALSDKIAADPDGIKPWCAGVESGSATGWPATDWLEEVVLRQAGPDVYDQWIAHKVKFNSPEISKALATVGSIWKNPKYVNAGIGDVASIATTDFSKAGAPIQAGKCYMMQQANFYATNWTAPPTSRRTVTSTRSTSRPWATQFGKPVEVGGEFIAAFNTRPEVQAFQYYLSTAHWANNQSKADPLAHLGQQGSAVDQRHRLDQPAVRPDPPGPEDGLPLRRLRPDAGGRGLWCRVAQLTAWITGQDDATTLPGDRRRLAHQLRSCSR